MAGLRWRGSWTAAPGGVASINSGEKFLPPPLSFVFFRSQWLSVLGLVLVFRFRFPSFWFASVLPSLSSFGSLLLTISVFFSFFRVPFLFCFFSLFIENKTEQVRLSCVPSITQRLVGHWGEFGGGGGEERERRDV